MLQKAPSCIHSIFNIQTLLYRSLYTAAPRETPIIIICMICHKPNAKNLLPDLKVQNIDVNDITQVIAVLCVTLAHR